MQRTNRQPRGHGGASGGGQSVNANTAILHGIVSLNVGDRSIVPLVVDVDRRASASQIETAFQSGARIYRLLEVGLCWPAPGQFDYQDLDARLIALQLAAPSALFIVHATVDPPAWWLREHPGECARYLENTQRHDATVVSWASVRWRSEAGGALTRLIRRVHGGDHGARCVGWQLASGESGEWRYPEAADLPDDGAAMTARYRAWALEKYRRNGGLLRKAWFDARAEFASIRCPGAQARRRGDFGALRNPRRSQQILDYYESLSDAQNSAALHFCALARDACDGKALIGLAYAPIFECDAAPEDGHGMPEAVLDSPDVQFFANRASSDGAYARALTGSLALRGKLLFHSVTPGTSAEQGAAVAITHQIGLILPSSTNPHSLQTVANAMDRARPLSVKVRHRTSAIAVIVDTASRYYVAEPAGQAAPINTCLLTLQIAELTRLGTPFDLYLLSDLFNPKFPDHKVVMFLNSFYLSEAERRRVDARVKRSGTTAVWLWGAGLIGEEGVSAEYGHRLCGQKVRIETGSISLRARIVEGDDPLTWGTHPGTHFGLDRAISPIVTVADKSITRLGANTDNKTVFSVRRSEDWTSVVFGAYTIPTMLLRNLMRAAGAHLFSDAGDIVVHADARSVAMTSRRGGQVVISLAGRYDVVDGWRNLPVARGVSEFTVTLNPGQTALYELTKRGADRQRGPSD